MRAHTQFVLWQKAMLTLGLVMLLLGFAVGAQPGSVSVNHGSYTCDSIIPTSWFVSAPSPDDTATAATTSFDRRGEARCQGVELQRRWLTWGAFGVGGLLALVGWTVVREAEADRGSLAARGRTTSSPA